jgi:hypothetical protein
VCFEKEADYIDGNGWPLAENWHQRFFMDMEIKWSNISEFRCKIAAFAV